MPIELEFDESESTKEIDLGSPVKQSIGYGLTKQPDQHSRVVSLADRERLPVEVVERNMPDLQARENRSKVNADIDQIEFDTPVTAKALADPDTAAMAHDDLDNLTALERIYRKQEEKTLSARHARAVKRGAAGVGVAAEAGASYLDKIISGIGQAFLPKPRGISGEEWEKKQETLNVTRGVGGLMTAAKAYGEIAPDEKIQEFSQLVDTASEKQGTTTAIFKGVEFLAQNPSVLSVLLAEQVVPMGLSAPIAPLTGLATKPLIAKITNEAARRYAERTALMASIQFSTNMASMYGAEIAQGINDGMTVDKALDRARTKSLAESGANAMFAFLPVSGGRVAQVAKETLKQGVAGATGAAVGTLAVGEDITLSEMMLEFFGEMTTAPADIAIAGHASVLEKQHDASVKEQTVLLTSNIDQLKLDELVNVAKANKLGGRNSDRFGQFMQNVVETYGEDAQVFIDGDQVAGVISDMDPELPGVQEMQRQLAQGGDIAIPLESYIADISRSSAGDQIRPHVRLDVDGLSQVELEEAVPLMEQRVKDLLEKADLAATETTRVEEITDQIFTQLMDTGRVSTQIAKMSSQIIPAYVATKASEYGLTVDAMYEKLGFGGVKGPEGAVVLEPGEQLEQAKAEGYEGVDTGEAAQWVAAKAKGLDMSTEARMERARDLGFDTGTVWFHGTDESFDAFDLSRGGENFNDQASREGVFFAAQRGNAELYGDNVVDSLISFKNPKVVDAEGLIRDEFELLSRRGEFAGSFSDFIDEYLEADPYGFYETGQLLDDILSAKKEGHDSLIVDFGSIEMDRGGKFAVAFDPSNIRSINAAFDPEAAESSDLLAQSQEAVTTESVKEFSQQLEQAKAEGYEGVDTGEAAQWVAAKAKGLDMSTEARMERAKSMGFDVDQIILAGSFDGKDPESITPYGGIIPGGGESLFGGIFGSFEEDIAASHGDIVREYVSKKHIDADQLDTLVYYEEKGEEGALNALRSDALLDFTDEEGGEILEYVMEKKNVFNEPSEMGGERLGDILGKSGLDEISFALQAMRGFIAKDLGATSVGMPDEHGESVLILPGSRSINAAFDPEAAESSDLLAQPEQEPAGNGKKEMPPRAVFDIGDRVITLLEGSDPSSFIHESGHLFLEMEKQLSAEFGITDRQQDVLDWLGIESFDQVEVKHHEKFARGFEAYTFEGKAPSRNLAAVFASFRRWMLEIYKQITRLNAPLTPEVREFFDHMLATDAQIEEVRANPAYEQFFRDAKSAGMTDKEWQEYQERQEASKNKSTSTLEQKILNQLKRRYTKEWKAERSEIVKDETAKLMEQPVYQATKFMRAKSDPRGKTENKMNSASVKELFDGKVPPKLLGMVSKESSLTPDEIALDHGYSSGDQMLQEIITTPSLKTVAEESADRQMIAKHGDILNDGTIEQEARDASQNEDKAKALMIELRALNKQAGTAQDIDRASLKAGAERTIASAKVSDIRPSRFYRAEIKAAQKSAAALEAGNVDEARGHKIQQLANHYLYREALDAEKKVISMRRYIAGVKTRKLSPKMVDSEYIHQMKILAAAYDFRTGKKSEQEAKSALLNLAGWIESQMSSENWIVPQFMDPTLSEMVAIKNNDAIEPHEKSAMIEQMVIPRYDEMTMEQLRGAYEMIKNLRYVGGRLSKGEAEVFKQLTEETADSIIEHGGKNIPRPQEQSTAFKVVSAIKQFGADHVVLGNTIAQMDGYQKFGPLFKVFYQQILDSTNAELKLKRDVHGQLEEIFGKFKRKDLAKGFRESGHAGHRQITKTNGEKWSLSRRGRLILAMYWGSPESRVALTIGNDVSETDAIAMISTLSKKELDFVQNIWDLNEGLWPQVSATALKMTGVSPPKVEHVPYEVNGRKMPGGYIRLFYDYDARDSYLAATSEDGSLTRSGGHVMKNTRHGSRNERVGSGGRPVSFELDNLFRALDENIHDIAFAETARDGTRFLQSKAIRNAVVLKYGKETYESLNASMEGIIAGNFASNHPINSMLRYLRTNASYAMLGYSIRNLMQQPVAVTNVFGKIGERYTLKGMAEFVFNPMKAKARVEWIQARSEFMTDRTSIINRETAEIANKIEGGLLAGPLKRHAFDLQTMGDAMIAYPAWYGAYLKELDRSGSEKQAITFADESTAQAVGSGLMKDLSPMMQGSGQLKVIGPEMLKSITFMGSYFNKVANLTRDAYKENDLTTVKGGAEFTRQMAWYLMIPAVVSALIVDDLPDEDDDEGWIAWAAGTMRDYSLAQVFILRDLVYLWNGFTPSTPYTRAVTEAGRTVKLAGDIATGEKEPSAEVLAKLTRNVSAFVPLPGAGQAARTIEGVVDGSENNNRNLYQMLVEGKER